MPKKPPKPDHRIHDVVGLLFEQDVFHFAMLFPEGSFTSVPITFWRE